jgi:hypothetical protein
MFFRRIAWSILVVGCAVGPKAGSTAGPELQPNTEAEAKAAYPPARSPEGKKAYFYTGKSYGSEAAFNPVTEFLNEGFDVLNTPGYDRRVLNARYDAGFRTVARSVANPGRTIREYGGFSRVVRNELLPLSGTSNGGGYWTGNYGLHLFGSGMVSARMREWYAARGVKHPELAANVSMFAAHLMNEVAEVHPGQEWREEALPDLFLFDGLGMLLYHFESVQRLMSNEHVQLTNWQLQPIFVLPDSTLENVGQRFALKVRLPYTKRWSAFTELGLAVQAGISYRLGGGDAITIAGGPRSIGYRTDSLTGKREKIHGGMASLYYDRENSLLAGLNWDQQQQLVRLNVYPNVLRVGTFAPGFLIEERAGRMHFGIASAWSPGIGFGRAR